MPLFQQSGGVDQDRRVEADRIYKDLYLVVQSICDSIANEKKARETVEFIISMRPAANRSVSPKQLFWLRDLHDRHVKGC